MGWAAGAMASRAQPFATLSQARTDAQKESCLVQGVAGLIGAALIETEDAERHTDSAPQQGRRRVCIPAVVLEREPEDRARRRLGFELRRAEEAGRVAATAVGVVVLEEHARAPAQTDQVADG